MYGLNNEDLTPVTSFLTKSIAGLDLSVHADRHVDVKGQVQYLQTTFMCPPNGAIVHIPGNWTEMFLDVGRK